MKGPEIKKIREDVWVTQQKMADDLGIAISTISRWENNGTDIKINEMALKYAHMTRRLKERKNG